MKRTIGFALVLAVLFAAAPSQAEDFIRPGSYGSVTMRVLDDATSLAGGVFRLSNKVVRDDEDYAREAILFQMPHFQSAPAAFSAPFAFRRHSRTRIVLINTDDVNPIVVRVAFYRPDGTVIGCNETELAPHQRKSRSVQSIPLSGCP